MTPNPETGTRATNVPNTGRNVEFAAVPVRQAGGRVQYSTRVAGDLVHDLWTNGLLKPDIWSHVGNPDGYQRAPVESRAKRFSRYIARDDGNSPVSVLLYFRSPGRVQVTGHDPHMTVTLDIDQDNPIYVPDGQHRLLGLTYGVTADAARLGGYSLPAVLMIAKPNASLDDARFEEATQFYDINNNQKRVATDLAQRYRLRALERIAAISPGDVIPQDKTQRELEPYGLSVVDLLNNDPAGPWHDLIDLPNVPTSSRPVSQNSFIGSVAPLVSHASEYGWTVEKVANTVSAFWAALEQLTPEAMQHWKGDGHADPDHEDFVIRTTSGVFSLNGLLAWLVGWHRIGTDPTDPDVYENLLRNDSEHFNDEFWNVINGDGAAGYGTSQGAFARLKKDIQQGLISHLA